MFKRSFFCVTCVCVSVRAFVFLAYLIVVVFVCVLSSDE